MARNLTVSADRFSGCIWAYAGNFIRRHFNNGLLITTAFTWSKGMDYQNADDGAFDFHVNFQRNYARTDFDRTYTYVQSFVYQLPWGKGERWMNSGAVSTILGNWQLAGIISAYSGTPLTFTVGSTNGNGGTLKTPGNTQTPDQVAPIQVLSGINTDPWFSTASFAQPSGAVFGTLGRNVMSGPGLLNLSLFKDFKFKERWQFELLRHLQFHQYAGVCQPGHGPYELLFRAHNEYPWQRHWG
jgi:hypothetical protein